MMYPDGQEAHIGDKVELWSETEGIVVCSIDSKEYSTEYPEAEWVYLKKGVLIYSSQAGLIHYEKPEPTMKLLQREIKK